MAKFIKNTCKSQISSIYCRDFCFLLGEHCFCLAPNCIPMELFPRKLRSELKYPHTSTPFPPHHVLIKISDFVQSENKKRKIVMHVVLHVMWKQCIYCSIDTHLMSNLKSVCTDFVHIISIFVLLSICVC